MCEYFLLYTLRYFDFVLCFIIDLYHSFSRLCLYKLNLYDITFYMIYLYDIFIWYIPCYSMPIDGYSRRRQNHRICHDGRHNRVEEFIRNTCQNFILFSFLIRSFFHAFRKLIQISQDTYTTNTNYDTINFFFFAPQVQVNLSKKTRESLPSTLSASWKSSEL